MGRWELVSGIEGTCGNCGRFKGIHELGTHSLLKKMSLWRAPGWLKTVEHVTLDLSVVSSSPTLGVEIT